MPCPLFRPSGIFIFALLTLANKDCLHGKNTRTIFSSRCKKDRLREQTKDRKELYPGSSHIKKIKRAEEK